MAIAWKDKQNINILTDMHRSLAGGKVLCWLWKHWSQLYYKTLLTDTWHMQTRVTAWQTVTPLADACGNWQKIVFSPSGPFSSEQFYSHSLWFRTVSSKFQTCLSQGPNTRGGGCLDHRLAHREDQPLLPANQPDLTYNMVNIVPQKENEFGAACVLWKTKQWGQNSKAENVMWGCVLIPASGCVT
jgi:hypothetical protein